MIEEFGEHEGVSGRVWWPRVGADDPRGADTTSVTVP